MNAKRNRASGWPGFVSIAAVFVSLGGAATNRASAEPDSFRAELDRCIEAYNNAAERIKDGARATLEDSLAKAKAKDPKLAEKVESKLVELKTNGRIPNESTTSKYLTKLRAEEAQMQLVYERAEFACKQANNPAAAEEVAREREAFLERLATTEEDRFLRSQNLVRRGKYYVSVDVEKVATTQADEVNRLRKLVDESIVAAREILEVDAKLSNIDSQHIDVVSNNMQIRNLINNGRPNKVQLVALQADLTAGIAKKLELEREFNQVWLLRTGPKKREALQRLFDERFAAYKEGLLALKPLLKDVVAKYRVAQTPKVRDALKQLGLGIGPSDEIQAADKSYRKRMSELKSMNIDLRSGSYQLRPGM